MVHSTQLMPCPISCCDTTSPHVYRADNGDGHAPPLPREELELMLEAARWAPTHKLTQPWCARQQEAVCFIANRGGGCSVHSIFPGVCHVLGMSINDLRHGGISSRYGAPTLSCGARCLRSVVDQQ